MFQRVAKRGVERKSETRWEERANIYSEAMNRGIQKRATPTPPKLTCDLFLQSDPKLWDYMTRSRGEGGLGYVSRHLRVMSIPDFLPDHVGFYLSILRTWGSFKTVNNYESLQRVLFSRRDSP